MIISVKKKNLFQMSAVIIGFWVFAVSAAESIYKWVDEDGSVHFSDHPPRQVIKSEKLRIDSTPNDEVVREAQRKRDSLRTKQQSSHDQRIAAREQKGLQAELEQEEREDRHTRCMKAHEEIQSLDHHMPIYYINETGYRVFLDDNERADIIEFYQREKEMFCE